MEKISEGIDKNMDATLSWLVLFTSCFSYPWIFFSMRKIIRERRQDREWLLAGDPRPQWYMNFCDTSRGGECLFYGDVASGHVGLLRGLCSAAAMRASFFVWLLFSFLFLQCHLSDLHHPFRRIRAAQGRAFGWRNAGPLAGSFTLHRGLAAASFWAGLPVPLFLIGWKAVNSLSSNPMDVYFWLVGIFAGLSGLYWLGTYALEFLRAYRRVAGPPSSEPRPGLADHCLRGL